MNPSESLFTVSGKPLSSCTGYCPLILFAEGFPTNNRAVLQFVPLSTEGYATLPQLMHLFSLSLESLSSTISRLSSRFAPGSYLVGGVLKHLFSLLCQLSLSPHLTWVKDSDLQLLTPPQEVVARPKLGIQVSRLNQKTQTIEVEKEPTLMNLEQKTKNNHFFYDEKYPELIASMIQTKVVHLGRKQGFEFIAYYNSRGNKKQNSSVCSIKQSNLLRIKREQLAMRLLLLLTEQGEQRGLGHANHLETNSGNITDSMARTTESSNQHFIVLIDVVQATIAGNESSDLLSVLDQLDTHALTNSRVGLLGLHSSKDRSNQIATYTFSRTIPFAIVAPPSTFALMEEMLCPFLYF